MTAVFSTLIGGLLALAGALMGPHFQRRHERWRASREDRELLRRKAEELFDELDRFVENSQATTLAAFVRLQDNTAEIKKIPDLSRVRSIAAIYFPTSLAIIECFEVEDRKAIERFAEDMGKSFTTGREGHDSLKKIPVKMATERQRRAAEFVSDIRAHVVASVPKLEPEGSS